MFTVHLQTPSLVLGLLGVLSGALSGALVGFFVSMRDTSVHFQTGGFFFKILWLAGFVSKGVLLGAGVGALLMILVFLIFAPDISFQSH